MSVRTRLFWIVAILAPLCVLSFQLASKYQPAPPQATANVALKFSATEFKFAPSSGTVKSGSPVNVTLTDGGSVDHTWVLLDKDGKTVLTRLDAKVGQSVSKDFTAPAAGSYTFICDVPGHREAGMSGTLTVN